MNILAQTKTYAAIFDTWHGDRAKALGPKPTPDQLATVHGLNCRPGKQALAIAMSLRDKGVTGSQIVLACGAPQLNKMRGLWADAYLKREPAAPGNDGHTVYKSVITPKGLKRVERAVAAAEALVKAGEATATSEVDKPAKPAKVTKARKPRVSKATGEPATPPATEPPPVTLNERGFEVEVDQPTT